MRFHLKLTLLMACIAGAVTPPAIAENKIDFFKRFLDESPTATAESTNLAQDWLKDVAASAASAQPLPRSADRQPLRLAAKLETPSTSTPAPLVRDLVPEPEQPPIRMAARPLRKFMTQPKPPVAVPKTASTEAVTAEVKKIEATVKQRVDSLQLQLEAEERTLETRLAEFNKRRDAALEKSDEAALTRIEKAEQTAVANYERKVQRLLSAALPESTTTPSQVATQSVPTPAAATRTMPTAVRQVPQQQPVQKPVATRRQPTPKSLPSWAQPQRQQPNRATQQRIAQPKSPAKYRVKPTLSRTPSVSTKQQTQQQPPAKKKFRLWPFK